MTTLAEQDICNRQISNCKREMRIQAYTSKGERSQEAEEEKILISFELFFSSCQS